MSRRLVLGNWKMNTTLREASALAEALATSEIPAGVDVGVAPPFPWLSPVAGILGASTIRLGAQTCSQYVNGAFTGDTSVSMLAEMCDFVLVGHSERRALFGEKDDVVHEKMARVIETGIQAVLCVGETADQRATGKAESTVCTQLDSALAGFAPAELDSFAVAYEPVWAIGTGNTATPEDAGAMCEFIRRIASDVAQRPVLVLYGGSVTAANAADLTATGQIDGFLVGGASLKANDFVTIIRAAAN